MNAWLVAAIAVSAALLPCADMCLRGSPERRLVGLQMAGVLIILAMTLLSIGSGRYSMVDLPLALAILSFGSGLIFARFLEKHL